MKCNLGRRAILIALGIVLVFSLVGCSGKKDSSEKEKKTGTKIGFCFDTFVIERWERDRDVFVSTANELGAEVDVQNPNGDIQRQIDAIQHFIDEEVDVIVVVPIDSDELTAVLGKAKEKGIKIISYDRLVDNANLDLYISFDNEYVGTCMGKSMNEKLEPGDKVIMVCGPETDSNVTPVGEGFKNTIKESGAEIVDEVHLDEWKAELAYDYVNEHIDYIRNNVKGIMCGNDNLASQVIFALSENRLAGDIIVTGQDADLDACQRIVEGTQYMTVYKSVNLLAEQAARSAVDLALDKEIVYDETINNGFADVPYIKLAPMCVNSENMDAVIIEGGFHQKGEVYINK